MLGGLLGSGNTTRPVWIVAPATLGAMSPNAAASAAMLATRMRTMGSQWPGSAFSSRPLAQRPKSLRPAPAKRLVPSRACDGAGRSQPAGGRDAARLRPYRPPHSAVEDPATNTTVENRRRSRQQHQNRHHIEYTEPGSPRDQQLAAEQTKALLALLNDAAETLLSQIHSGGTIRS
jgi:hypothetical protein